MASTVNVGPSAVAPVFSNNPKSTLVQNNGQNNVYVSDSPNVTVSTGIVMLPGTPLQWPPGQELWAITALGLSSSLTYLDNGAEIGVSVSALQTVINSLAAITASTATPQPNYINAAAANTEYRGTVTLVSGIYVISCPAGVNSFVDFYDVNGNFITEAATVAGTITLNIATQVGQIKYWTTSGVNTQIEILKQGSSIAPVSGTLTTVTATGTPGLVGAAYVVVVGAGGGGGGGANSGSNSGGGGGGSGGITGGRVTLTGSESLVIGNNGIGGAFNNPGTAGTATTFAGFTAGGGGGGAGSTIGTTQPGGVAGSPNGAIGATGQATTVNNGNASAAASTIFPFFTQGTTGSGNGGGVSGSQATAGNGIGTGGLGGVGTAGQVGTGFGSGGGGGGAGANSGGNGKPGVVYIIQ